MKKKILTTFVLLCVFLFAAVIMSVNSLAFGADGFSFELNEDGETVTLVYSVSGGPVITVPETVEYEGKTSGNERNEKYFEKYTRLY